MIYRGFSFSGVIEQTYSGTLLAFDVAVYNEPVMNIVLLLAGRSYDCTGCRQYNCKEWYFREF